MPVYLWTCPAISFVLYNFSAFTPFTSLSNILLRLSLSIISLLHIAHLIIYLPSFILPLYFFIYSLCLLSFILPLYFFIYSLCLLSFINSFFFIFSIYTISYRSVSVSLLYLLSLRNSFTFSVSSFSISHLSSTQSHFCIFSLSLISQ